MYHCTKCPAEWTTYADALRHTLAYHNGELTVIRPGALFAPAAEEEEK